MPDANWPMFRFTIRELVLLTLVVAMGVGWWVDRSRLATANASLVAECERLKDIGEKTFLQFLQKWTDSLPASP
jgi:hypothetical protein